MLGVGIFLAFLGGFISCKHTTGVVICGTAFLGSYLFTYGISIAYANDYPDPKHYHEFDGTFWFYLIFFLICFVFSVLLQNKMDKDKEAKKVWAKEFEPVHHEDHHDHHANTDDDFNKANQVN